MSDDAISFDFAEPLALDFASSGVRLERDGQWYVARPATLKPGCRATGCASKLSFEDAEETLRRQMEIQS